MIRFELGRDNKLFIRQISYLEHSTDTLGMYQAVLNSNVPCRFKAEIWS